MERESFEDEQIAQLQNDLVVSIKVDREERPDVDDIYMDAVQLLQGHGGWPLNVFCTPDGRPFFGGTYFPPQGRTGMPGWPDVLRGISRAWQEQRTQVEQQAEQLTQHLNVRVELAAEESSETAGSIRRRAASQLLENRDRTYGGFGGAPKFPQPAYLHLMLQQALDPGAADANVAREHLSLTLRRMAEGGIYDQLQGGFHRYSVDQIWLVPHFEKMLYDNALLIPLYLAAWRLTGDELFRRIAAETCDYLLSGLQTPDGAFFASTDADSEGVEGKYFVWTRDELFELLPADDAQIACRYWGVDIGGNFEGQTILNVVNEAGSVARWLNISEQDLNTSLQRSRQTLLASRAGRIPPATDTKVITAWNGLAIDALAQTGAQLGEPRLIAAAERAATFILDNMHTADGALLRIHAGGRASVQAFLEDYAALADGCLSLYEATADEAWFAHGQRLAEEMCARFWDDEHGAFFGVAHDGEELIARRKPTQDGATPSGNAVAARAMTRLYALTAEGPLGRPRRVLTPRFQRLPGTRPHDAGRLRQRARLARTAPHDRHRRQRGRPRGAADARGRARRRATPDHCDAARPRPAHGRPATRRQARHRRPADRLRLPRLRLQRTRALSRGAAYADRGSDSQLAPEGPGNVRHAAPDDDRRIPLQRRRRADRLALRHPRLRAKPRRPR